MRERSPRQLDAGTLRLGCGRLRFRAADRGNAALAARDPLCRFMDIADRTLAADGTVIAMRRRDAEALCQQLLRIAIAPAQVVDDVELLHLAERLCASVCLGAPQGVFLQSERR